MKYYFSKLAQTMNLGDKTVYGTDESVILETMIVTIPDIRRNMFHSHLLFNNI